jgi:hypothetical protein
MSAARASPGCPFWGSAPVAPRPSPEDGGTFAPAAPGGAAAGWTRKPSDRHYRWNQMSR